MNAAIHVSTGGTQFLIDCGASALIGLKRHKLRPADISHALISHLHGDHFGGLPFLIRETQIAAPRTTPFTIAGPTGLRRCVTAALEALFPGAAQVPLTFPLKFVELPPFSVVTLGDLRVTAYPVVHTPGTNAHALRVQCHNHTIAYSGDTGWTDTLLKAAADSDLFICEAYTFDRVLDTHMDYQALQRHRADLTCKRIVLTHCGEELLQRAHEVTFDTAHDGLELVLTREKWASGKRP